MIFSFNCSSKLRATLTTSRVLAVRQAREYDLILFPAALPGGGGLTVSLQF